MHRLFPNGITKCTNQATRRFNDLWIKKHLLGGVAKGAFTEAEAEARFNKWADEKQGKIDAKNNKLASDANAAKKAQLAAEAKIKEERAAAIAEKKAAAAAEAAAAAAEENAENSEAPAEEA